MLMRGLLISKKFPSFALYCRHFGRVASSVYPFSPPRYAHFRQYTPSSFLIHYISRCRSRRFTLWIILPFGLYRLPPSSLKTFVANRSVFLRPPRHFELFCRSALHHPSMGRPLTSKRSSISPKENITGSVTPINHSFTSFSPPHPAQLKKLTFSNGSILTDSGAPILEGVTSHASVTSHSDSKFLVLGMEMPNGEPASLADFPLGLLRCKRWLACARNKLWWMTPEWGVRGRDLPPETQFLLTELEGGEYAIMLPLIDSDTFRGTLRPPRNSGTNGPKAESNDVIYLRMESGDDAVLGHSWQHAILLASANDPYALIEIAVPEAAKYSGTAKPLREKRLPPSIDKFAWCSWDAFYSSVSAQGLVDGVRSLAAGGAPPKMVIIDDGWQSTDLDSQFKGWQDPGTVILEQARQRLESLGSLGSMDEASVGGGGSTSDGKIKIKSPHSSSTKEIAREPYIEGEAEMISAILRDIPAGTATGQLLQEAKAADDENQESIDYYTIAQQHDAVGCGPVDEDEAMRRRQKAHRRRHAGIITRASLTVVQYVAGLIVGAFQALVILFYQWVVDPAEDGTWPVRLFTYLAAGPLRSPMLQFYADQTNFTRRLVDIRANSKFHAPDATPEAIHSGKKEDLASVVSHLRSELSVEHIYCWHGLSAYWSGVCPNSPAMKKYNPRIVYAKPPKSLREIEPSMLWNPSVLGGLGAVYDPAPLFKDMHSYLAASGVNGVKVDCQAGVGMVGSVTGGGPAVAARYHAALEDSVAAHFPSNDAINCMCHSTENIYRWRDTAVARASDDFFPTDTASHLPHIAACAFNGLFLSALALPDFDMFQSKHSVASLHAAARAVSGGPVYVSDAPGHHNFDILHQLVLPDGSVLRAKLPGRPTRDCLFSDVMRDNASLLKIWNVNSTTGVVGVFNLQGSSWDRSRRRFAFHNHSPPRLTMTVKVSDVECFLNTNSESDMSFEQQDKNEHHQSRSSTPSDVSTYGHYSSSMVNGYESDVSTTTTEDAASQHMATIDNHHNRNGRVVALVQENGTSPKSTNYRPRPARLLSSGEFAAYINITDTLQRIPIDGSVDVSLEGGHAAIVTFAPFYSNYGVEFAPIGLKNMLNSGGAVLYTNVEADRSQQVPRTVFKADEDATEEYTELLAGDITATEYEDETSSSSDSTAMPPVVPRFHVGIRGRGTLIAWCSREPEYCSVDGYSVRFTWSSEDSRLEIQVPQVGRRTEQELVVQFRK